MKKMLLISALLLVCTIYIFQFKVNAADNLVGYWKFDAGTGSTAVDSSGENVSGTFSATAPTWSTDVPPTDFTNPYALDFTRTGDRVAIAWPSALNFDATDQRSFSFWYKPTADGETASGNFDRIISWSNDGFEIAGTFGDVSVHRLAFYDGSWRDTNFNMTVGTWYNITFTYDGTNVKLYVNNVEKFSGTSGGRALSGTMYIGARHTGDEGINGIIDDVRVYDRALTPGEVQDLSEGGSGPGVPTATPTASPTPTVAAATTTTAPTSNNTSSTNSTSCTAQSPSSAPDLFQVSTSPTTATVYFTPVNPVTGYIIQYGTNSQANQYSASFDHANGTGAVSYTIHALSKGTTYYFRVQGKNSCIGGNWSPTVAQTTTGGLVAQSGSRSDSTPTPIPTPKGTIEVTSKEQTSTQKQEQSQQKDSEADGTTDGYALSITVLNNDTPVEGAVVEVHSTPRRTTTDKNGIARFSNIEKGEHTVYLSYQGYQGEEKVTVNGEDKDIAVNFTVELKPGNTFFSQAAIGVVIALIAIILALLLFIWKKRKS